MINKLQPNFSDLPSCRTIPRNYKHGTTACQHIDVSIITPYYNTGDIFVETFISIQVQSLQNWEWIIVDDGSTNQDAIKRLTEFAAKDDRIQIVRQTNAGTAAARNTGFRHSKGRYICLLDHDDMLEPTYLEKCAWFLDSNTEFAFCNSYSVVFDEQEFLWTAGFERGKYFLEANSGPPISVVRREAYLECGGFDETIRVLYEDWDFWLAMAKVGLWGYTIPEYLQWYRKLGSGRYEQILQSGYVNDEFSKIMQQKYQDIDQCFPEPSRRALSPYETIIEHSLVCNPLADNSSGRRIMFIVPWMVTGGADRVNLDLIEGLTEKGHDVTVCATLQADHQWEHQFSRFTPDIFILPNFLHAADYPRFLAYLIQSRQIDTVMITGSTIGYHFLPYLRAISPNVAFVDMCHVEEPHWLNGGHPRFGIGYQDALDLNIVTTQHLANWMYARGADSERIRVMHTGIRSLHEEKLSATRERIRAELNIAIEMPVIVFAGRLCEQKRPVMLVEILKMALDNGLKFQALIIGDGKQKTQVENLITKYELSSNIQMLGSVAHEKWLAILAASDILLMPSQYEGISIALLEAMAAGAVPVVAKVGGQEEIVTSNAGILIEHGTDELQDYFNALQGLLSDSTTRQQMSMQCKLIASSKLSWGNMIDNFVNHLDEAHQFRTEHPRYPISPRLGKELASLALEYKRLDDAVNYLWQIKPSLETFNPSLTRKRMAQFVIFLRKTWLGDILVTNSFLKAIGRQAFKIIIGSK